jgi:hypothetical protein
MQETVTNKFLSSDEMKNAFYKFLYQTEGALDHKYAVNVRTSAGQFMCFLTFASSFQEAFESAKCAYQAAHYPLVGVDKFAVLGICKSTTCPFKGESHAVLFLIDWSTAN